MAWLRRDLQPSGGTQDEGDLTSLAPPRSDALVLGIGRGDLAAALFGAWAAVTLATTLSVAASRILPYRTLASMPFQCETKAKHATPCALCGMTRAFAMLSHGRVREAQMLNRFSLTVYACFVINGAVFCAAVFSLARRRLRSRNTPVLA